MYERRARVAETVQQYVFGRLELFTVQRLAIPENLLRTPREIHGPSVGPGFPRVAERLVRQHVFGPLDLFGVHRLLIWRER